jgi:hypothetical protein
MLPLGVHQLVQTIPVIFSVMFLECCTQVPFATFTTKECSAKATIRAVFIECRSEFI